RRRALRRRRQRAQAHGRVRARHEALTGCDEMTAEIIDGKQIAGRVRIEVAREVERFTAEFGGARPGLATILVGDDPASAVYVAGKQKASREVGTVPTNYPVPADTPRDDLVAPRERL